MKVTLNFNFPEEEIEFRDAINGREFRLAIGDLHNWLRDLVKQDKELVKTDDVRDKLHECLAGRKIL